MTPERFLALAEAYGGTVRRWPEDVRVEALRMAAEPWARAALEAADALDVHLDAWEIAPPSAALTAAIVQGAPRPSLARRARLWLSALGLAAALSGAAAGAGAAAAMTPVDHPGAETAFGDIGGEG